MSTAFAAPLASPQAVEFDEAEMLLLNRVLSTMQNLAHLREKIRKGEHLVLGMNDEEIDSIQVALATQCKDSIKRQETLETLDTWRPIAHLGAALMAANRLKLSEFTALLLAIPEERWPRTFTYDQSLWAPVIEKLATQRPAPSSQLIQQTLKKLGVSERVWKLQRGDSLLSTIVNYGPGFGNHDGWKSWVEEGLEHTPIERVDPVQAAKMTQVFLTFGHQDLAETMIQRGWIDPCSVSLGFAHAPVHQDEAWTWLTTHVDPRDLDTSTGAPIWKVLAKPVDKVGGLPSARLWAKLNEPDAFRRLEIEEYFDELLAARGTPETKDALLKRPDWATVCNEKGEPALWLAVRNFPDILTKIPIKKIDWSVKTADGKDLWFAFIGSSQALSGLSDCLGAQILLSQHCKPSLDHDGNGWLCACPQFANSSTSPLAQTFFAGHALICWAGTPEKQEALAKSLLEQEWGTDGATPGNLLMAETQDDLEESGFSGMSPSLKAWWTIWSQGNPGFGNPLDLAQVFSAAEPLSLPPPTTHESDKPSLWHVDHPWFSTAQARIREWQASHHLETPSRISTRPRQRP